MVDDLRVETDLREIAELADFEIKFLTSPVSVLIDDYVLLREAVKDRDISGIQTFVWKYGVSALFGLSH